MKKCTEANSSKQEKDAEADSSKKAKRKKGKNPVADLDVEGHSLVMMLIGPREFTLLIENET